MTGIKFERLVSIMARLRGPEGCPWDKEQDFDTLKPLLIEEVYEVIDAVDQRDYDGLAEELGDVLLHVVFNAELGRELEKFNIETVIDGICEKLIRRHPHVFASEEADSAEAVIEGWEAIKAKERRVKSPAGEKSLFEGIPTKLPAFNEAHKISSLVARVGFDWNEIDGVFAKLQEEIQELREVIGMPDEEQRSIALEDEIGDALFVMVNIARHLNIDSESALKRANRKFRTRFQFIERELEKAGRAVGEASLTEMQVLWQRAKES